MLLSHGLAVPVLREHGKADTRVGITLNFSPAYPASNSEEDLLAARRHDGMSNRWFTDPIFKGYYPEDMWDLFGYLAPRVAPGDLEIISRPIDFLGVNYYTRALVAHDQAVTARATTARAAPSRAATAARVVAVAGTTAAIAEPHRT